jgi:hypothetical protein
MFRPSCRLDRSDVDKTTRESPAHPLSARRVPFPFKNAELVPYRLAAVSYAAIFGIKDPKPKGLGLVGTDYSWLSS